MVSTIPTDVNHTPRDPFLLARSKKQGPLNMEYPDEQVMT